MANQTICESHMPGYLYICILSTQKPQNQTPSHSTCKPKYTDGVDSERRLCNMWNEQVSIDRQRGHGAILEHFKDHARETKQLNISNIAITIH